MRKVFWTAAVLALSAAPLSAQQVEKSPFASVAPPALEAAAPQAEVERAPSLYLSREQVDESVRASEAQRGARTIGDRNFWTLVAAIAVGVIIASVVLN